MAIEGAGLVGGGALLGTIMAALGLKKMVSTEVETATKPLKADILELKTDMGKTMTEKSHKLICALTSANVAQRFDALEKSSSQQIESVKEHIDIKFDTLAGQIKAMQR